MEAQDTQFLTSISSSLPPTFFGGTEWGEGISLCPGWEGVGFRVQDSEGGGSVLRLLVCVAVPGMC